LRALPAETPGRYVKKPDLAHVEVQVRRPASPAIPQTSTRARPSQRGGYRFGPFIADFRKRLLWRDSQPVTLTPKAFEILSVLIERAGRVVEKDELVAAAWGQAVVEDATIARHISTLRRALDERPHQHAYILTVPGLGYEWVAEAIPIEDPPASAAILPSPLRPSPAAPALTLDAAARDTTVIAPASQLTPSTPAGALLHRHWVGRAALGAATAVAVTAAVLVFRADLARVARVGAPRSLRQFTFAGGVQREPAWSPHGDRVAYVSDAAGNSDIWVHTVSSHRAQRITSSDAEDSQPDWTPDGHALVFRSERDGGGIFVASADGGDARRLTTFGYRPKTSPDGRQILFASTGHPGGTNRWFVVDLAGGEPRPLRPDRLEALRNSDAAWRPDAAAVSVLTRRSTDEWSFVTVPLDGGTPIPSRRRPAVDLAIRDARLTLGRFAWARSGRFLFFEGTSERVRNVWRVTVDPATLEWIAGPERLTTGAGQDTDVAISPDGTRMLFSVRASRTRLWAFPFDPATGQLRGEGTPVTSGGAGEQDADASLDGSRLIYRAERGDVYEIWQRTKADGRDHLLISTTEWRHSRPRVSPDGQRIAYSRSPAQGDADAGRAVVVLDNGQEQPLTMPGDVALTPTDWSRDGRWLLGACQVSPPRRAASCVMPVGPAPVASSAVRIIAGDPSTNYYESRFSLDGRWVTFVAVDRTDARVSRIMVVPLAGGEPRAITDGLAYDDKPHWAGDGRTLYFLSDRLGFFNVWGRHIDPATGVPEGPPFQVTSITGIRRSVSSDLPQVQIAVTASELFLPITETTGELWVLDGVDR
jgi:Tol biopolymer transport system component/DNA-binding winged helix-turn-helix (wHTH) protein